MTAATLSRRVAEHVHDLRFEAIPPAAIDKAKDHLVNHLGLALGGLGLEDGRQAIRLAAMLSEGAGECTVIGSTTSSTALDAAFANCTLMRNQGLDDVLFPVGVHAGLMTFPVALALGEQLGRSGREVLTAIVAGYDVIGKLGADSWSWAAAVPRRPTIPFGPFGATAVAARLLGLEVEQTSRAIGYAAHSAMGLAEGNLVTHYYSLVCRNGLMAALLAREGGDVSPIALEGPFGFFFSFFGAVPDGLDATLATFGTDFEIFNATTKRYPGTALNIVAIELLLALVVEHGVEADDVERIELVLPLERRNFAEGHASPPFATRAAAASSVLFHLAGVLVDGRVDPARVERFEDASIAATAGRMSVALEPGHPIRYARLRVHLRDGRLLEAEGSDFTVPAADRRGSLHAVGDPVLGEAAVERALELALGLEALEDVGELMSLLRPGGDGPT